jgi:hypothetical protein
VAGDLLCGDAHGPEYYELNFSPSKHWAAYRFASYRNGMRPANEIHSVAITIASNDDIFHLEATVEGQFALPSPSGWRIGLSAVIEEIGGNKTFWALAHSQGKPDFHHADCFSYELPPAANP